METEAQAASLDYFSTADNITVPTRLKTFVSRLAFPLLSLLSREQISDNLFLAQTCSFLLGLAVSFLGNRNITFRSNGEYALSRGSQLWRYILLAFFNLILSNILIHILVAYMVAMVAKLAVMAAVILWNYAIFNKIIFRSK